MASSQEVVKFEEVRGRMRSWLLLGAAVAVVVALVGAVVYVAETTSTMFNVMPGGEDVVVRVDGVRVRPSVVDPAGNMYIVDLRHGKHLVTLAKTGFVSQRHAVTIRRWQGEAYPVFPPLQPRGRTARGKG